jgi:hypothetical protein
MTEELKVEKRYLPLRRWIMDHMFDIGMTQTELGQRLGWTSQRVTSVIKGYYTLDRPPGPIHFKDIPAWSDALELTAEQRETFRELVNLDGCEEWFAQHFKKLKADANRLARQSQR